MSDNEKANTCEEVDAVGTTDFRNRRAFLKFGGAAGDAMAATSVSPAVVQQQMIKPRCGRHRHYELRISVGAA